MTRTASILIMLFVLQLTIFSSAVHDSLNFMLHPKTRQCFYEDFEENAPERTVEIFVEAGGNSGLVHFKVYGPLRDHEVRLETFEDPIIRETAIDPTKETVSETLTYTENFKPPGVGTFAFCVDNRQAHFIPKLVQLDMRLADRPEPILLHHEEEKDEDEEMERVKESLSRIRKGLSKIQLQQQRDRHRLTLHSKSNEDTHNHVVIMSCAETAVFIAAAIFQLFFVRQWFANRTGNDKRQWA